MIRNSFVFLERIGRKKEEKLWNLGITNWQSFLNTARIKSISSSAKAYYHRQIKEAQTALLNEESHFFTHRLPKKEHWRLYEEFKENCCFLDIETDSQGRITVVGISNYYATKHLVKGFNLEKEILEKALAPCQNEAGGPPVNRPVACSLRSPPAHFEHTGIPQISKWFTE